MSTAVRVPAPAPFEPCPAPPRQGRSGAARSPASPARPGPAGSPRCACAGGPAVAAPPAGGEERGSPRQGRAGGTGTGDFGEPRTRLGRRPRPRPRPVPRGCHAATELGHRGVPVPSAPLRRVPGVPRHRTGGEASPCSPGPSCGYAQGCQALAGTPGTSGVPLGSPVAQLLLGLIPCAPAEPSLG